jgi:hypothetical protein
MIQAHGESHGSTYHTRCTILPACDSSFSTRASLTTRTSSCTSKWNKGPDLPRACGHNRKDNFMDAIQFCRHICSRHGRMTQLLMRHHFAVMAGQTVLWMQYNFVVCIWPLFDADTRTLMQIEHARMYVCIYIYIYIYIYIHTHSYTHTHTHTHTHTSTHIFAVYDDVRPTLVSMR